MTGGAMHPGRHATAPAPATGIPPAMARRPALRRWLLVAALTVVFGLCGLLMLALVGATAGVTGTVLGAVLSVVVVGIVVPVFLWVDRFESEPTGMLLFAFLWGACVATLGAAFLNDLGGYLLGAGEEGNPLVAVGVAPVVEETLKGLAPVLLLLFRRREIDGILDGMVYAGLAACGFAFVEDILYLANGYADAGEKGLFGVFVVRVLMSPFAHPMFTICTGIGVGVAATARKPLVRWTAPLLGWVCAITLHSLWNAAAVISSGGWLLLYVVVQVPLFLAFAGLLLWARRREASLIGAQLSPYADHGWLTHAEVAMLSSMPERRYARAWAFAHGGAESKKQMHEFQDAASELAMLRARLNRGQVDDRALAEERGLLDLMSVRRQQFLGTAIYRKFEVLGHL
ncbi:PrsW family intramembrane metalloprotease [Luteipulveratus flavus]|uniref:PrsW family intramembrane metalloprotease n=1 Tax=Luteipulveratus flavus TaxID=3031728 RepID=A0ABT6C8Z8_9MICO|nr:PrsW family intramembrane metalloprotease [Luteipulveratus sp. YIM 133296]MDF8265394.1 PrsW family intramembrane metalloprotease [Luteipulveratus sp. YIM 133296]